MQRILFIFFMLPLILIGANVQNRCEGLAELIKKRTAIPLAQLSHNKVIYSAKNSYHQSIVKVNSFDLAPLFAIRLSPPALLQKKYKGLIRYEISGVRVYQNTRLTRKALIYQDSNFTKTFNKELIYGFKNIKVEDDYPSSIYEIAFDKLILIDCEGKKNPLGAYHDSVFSIIIHTKTRNSPDLNRLGKPNLQLMINGSPANGNELIKMEDELSVKISFPCSPSEAIKQADFWVSAFSISEQGCFGGVSKFRASETRFPLYIPNGVLRVGFGGKFGMRIDDILYKDSTGKIYKIQLPYSDYSIFFLKEPIR